MAANFTRLNLTSYADDTWTTLKNTAGTAYSVGADTVVTVASLYASNPSGSAVTIGARIVDSGDNLVHECIPAGTSLDSKAVLRNNGEYNMVTGDKLQVKASATGCTFFASIIEE
jgi:hypothetical protein